ncbi:MAG TPA: hypothetical protein VN841_20555 [Bryobacteraceae bacterium]|nr:hypothetical protein [Bryobacteraceae bacterium]
MNLGCKHYLSVAAALAISAGTAFGQGEFGPYWQPPVVKGGPMPRTPDGHPNLNGYWAARFNRAIFDIEDQPGARPGAPPSKGGIVDPANGKIPYKPEAAERRTDLATNHIFEEPEAHCFMSGVPHSAYQQFGFQIIQTKDHFVFSYEYAHSHRIVPLDGRPHISPDIHLFMGDSVGHWEGDTLVIDTTNQNGKTWFDMVGNFTTPNMHVVERITPVDQNTVNYEATVTDATIYTQPWKVGGNWGRNLVKGYQQMEFGCDEGNQDLEHYVEGAGGSKSQVRGK